MKGILFSDKWIKERIMDIRHGHISYLYFERMSILNCVRRLQIMNVEETKCEVWIQGKWTRVPFNHVIEAATRILEGLHVDLCVSMKVHSFGWSKYMLLVGDEYSTKYFIDCARSKVEV